MLSCALGRKVAILGDMGELGENEKLLHYNVGCHAADAGIDAVFLVGELSKETARGIEAKNPSLTFRHFDTKQELINTLPLLLSKGDSILVKASHFMDFEEIVAYLKKTGERNLL